MNFLLRNLFFIFVFAFLVIDGFFLFGGTLLPMSISSIIEEYAKYSVIINITEVLILSSLAYFTSIKPIRSLKKEIAFFLTGSKQ